MKKFKNKIASVLYELILGVVKISAIKTQNESLLLIKNDEIGDYILFRNFLKDIRKSKKYEGYQITLLGNIIWKQLFDEFDNAYVDEVIWIEKKKFQKDLRYRFALLKTIRKKGF